MQKKKVISRNLLTVYIFIKIDVNFLVFIANRININNFGTSLAQIRNNAKNIGVFNELIYCDAHTYNSWLGLWEQDTLNLKYYFLKKKE